MSQREPRIVFLLAWERSGSTLLAQLLGELDGVFAMGEALELFRDPDPAAMTCGCGAKVGDCSVWMQVLSDLASSRDEARRLREAVQPLKRLPRILSSRAHADVDGYVAKLRHLYQSAARASGQRILVDNSKAPTLAALAVRTGLDVRVVHLIRDVRGAAYSWQRPKFRDTPKFRDIHRPPLYVARRWLAWNAAGEVLRMRLRERYMKVRYEDLVHAPEKVVPSLATFAGASATGLRFEGRAAIVEQGHQVAGNTARFQKGTVDIREDDEWRRGLSKADGITLTAATFPLLAAYGYPLGRKRPKP